MRACAGLLLAAQWLCLPLATETRADPQLTVIHSFNGDDGASPWAGLALGAGGTLFGTTRTGGSPDNHGTVFKLTPSSPSAYEHSVLHRFSGADGQFPQSGVVLGADGRLFGTTISGGSAGGGTVYQVARPNNPTRKHTVLRNFNFRIGETLVGNVVQDENGNLYGAASQSGRNTGGTLYKLTQPAADMLRASWPLTILRHFNANQIADSRSTLVRDADGNLYGTATGALGGGLIYRQAASGKLTILYVFPAGEGSPHAGLLMDGDGVLYDTAIGGGSGGNGVVFSLTPPVEGSNRWKFRELHGFNGFGDGGTPAGPLIMDGNGTLFGTTSTGGGFSGGTVFAIKRPLPGSKRWRHRTLVHLDISTGRSPFGALVRDDAGVLYGTASNGGDFNQGTVFKVVP